MLSGLIYPTGGEARVLGFVPWQRADAFRRQFALVMGQKNQLWWDLPAGDSFQLHREIYSIPDADFRKTLGELTEMFDVGELTRQPVRELSLGERMKMELIAALLHKPQLLLLDEPTIGLDVQAARTVKDWIAHLAADEGKTIVLTTHQLPIVQELADRIAVIRNGTVIADLPTADLLTRFAEDRFEVRAAGLLHGFAGALPAGARAEADAGATRVTPATPTRAGWPASWASCARRTSRCYRSPRPSLILRRSSCGSSARAHVTTPPAGRRQTGSRWHDRDRHSPRRRSGGGAARLRAAGLRR